jgi:hypothetical protein
MGDPMRRALPQDRLSAYDLASRRRAFGAAEMWKAGRTLFYSSPSGRILVID